MGASRMLTHTTTLAAALLLLIAPAPARAQSNEFQSNQSQQKESQSKQARPKEARPEEQTPPQVFCDSARAVSLVETQLSEAKMFDDASRRLSLMTRAADLLWPYERESAREIFAQAYDLAVKDFRAHENDPEPKGPMSPPSPDQRFVVMTAIARRDPAWARRLAEGVAEEIRRAAEQAENASASSASTAEGWKPGVAENTLNLAQSLLPVDRDAAVALARGSFRRPASYTLMFFIFKLAEIDQSAADAFYADALRAYRGRGATDLVYLSVYPFALNHEPASVPVAVYYRTPKGFSPTPRLRELFLEALFEEVERKFKTPEVAPAEKTNTASEHARLLTMLTTLEPSIARLSPSMLERALALKGAATAAATAQSRARAEGFQRAAREFQEEGMFERTLGQAEGERDPPKRDYAIASLVTSARDEAELVRAEGFLDRVSESSLREKLASYLYFRRTQQDVKDGRLDEAARLSKKVSEPDLRALLSLEIAGEALKKLDDRARAAEILDAVAAEASKSPDTPSKARALLGVAHLYAGFDATRSYQVLREAVKVVNLLPDPDFGSENVGRELGNSYFTMYAMYTVPGMRLENAFRELGALDFESALSAANELSDKYQRSLAVLGLASKCLEDSAKKFDKTPSQPKRKRPSATTKPVSPAMPAKVL